MWKENYVIDVIGVIKNYINYYNLKKLNFTAFFTAKTSGDIPANSFCLKFNGIFLQCVKLPEK